MGGVKGGMLIWGCGGDVGNNGGEWRDVSMGGVETQNIGLVTNIIEVDINSI